MNKKLGSFKLNDQELIILDTGSWKGSKPPYRVFTANKPYQYVSGLYPISDGLYCFDDRKHGYIFNLDSLEVVETVTTSEFLKYRESCLSCV